MASAKHGNLCEKLISDGQILLNSLNQAIYGLNYVFNVPGLLFISGFLLFNKVVPFSSAT